MPKKLRVAIIFGGASTEHSISLLSAKHVLSRIDKEQFEVIPIGIDLKGNWFQVDDLQEFLSCKVEALSSHLSYLKSIDPSLSYLRNTIDVVFPLIHGSPGEDGCLQGFFSLLSIPYVGCDTLSSAICMDKLIMKQLLQQAGIPIANYLSCKSNDILAFEKIQHTLGLPIVVKPANSGSALGVAKVDSYEEWKVAVDNARLLSDYVLFEEYILGRELECSVLGNKNPIVSMPGEIECEFYSYDAKYIHTDQARLRIPADISSKVAEEIQCRALQVFDLVRCRGMARVDFFLTEKGDLLVNEINTIPGFTGISLYPKLLELSGYSHTELITALLCLATEKTQPLVSIHE